jgi:hypothetical protein
MKTLEVADVFQISVAAAAAAQGRALAKKLHR